MRKSYDDKKIASCVRVDGVDEFRVMYQNLIDNGGVLHAGDTENNLFTSTKINQFSEQNRVFQGD